MVTPSAQPASRYRRRILGIGALATGALYVIGAPIFVDRIEADLESRVPAELDAAGFAGVTAAFSGQDGTLTCDAPLDDPEGAREAAFGIDGVRTVDVDRSCRVNTVAGTDDSTGDAGATTSGSTSGSAETAADESAAVSGSDTEDGVDGGIEDATSDDGLATVHEVVAANPDLAFLSVLLADFDIGRSDEPITLFAASNAAFDAVSPDVLGQIQNDPDVLRQVLTHHVVDGTHFSADLESGMLAASDGSSLDVVAGDGITVDGAMVVEADIVASNGVVHVIDMVLVPDDLRPAPTAEVASLAAVFDGERISLTGAAAGEADRQVLVDAAVEAAGATARVGNAITVDPEAGIRAETVAALVQMVRSMPANLRSGEVGFDGTALYAEGVARSDALRDTFVAAADAIGVEAMVADPPVATADEASAVEAQLNEFVAANPILFEPSSAVLAPSASPVLDQVALDAQQFEGLAVTVEGHTDSDGLATANLQLSQARAEVVLAALTERGLAPDTVSAVGFGSERPVVVDGTEDKVASRRVEFRVVATS
jgi:outer membrane protein OmpA-like peptidoglycan-associated protein/uncharacterized surface protein with fasciclin (FAS1) repeats